MFDPVVANTVEFRPSNKSALFAYDAVPNKDPVKLVATTGPMTFKDPVTITLPVNSNVSALIKKSLADDAVVAKEALKILFDPNGPKTLEDVTNDDVADVPRNEPVNDEADTDPNTDTLPVNDVLPLTISDPVIV
jgi:hypothetical protein